ncbi:MAG: hypothetical protein HYW88_01215 [Candidatus Sungbacteria bacterium]|nr:hypothetical protein [Candidatus Sungbacteria bacterium]
MNLESAGENREKTLQDITKKYTDAFIRDQMRTHSREEENSYSNFMDEALEKRLSNEEMARVMKEVFDRGSDTMLKEYYSRIEAIQELKKKGVIKE